MTWEKHLEHWIVGLRTGWLDWFFITLSWIGSFGAVWLALAFAIGVARHRPFETQLGPPSSTHSFPSGHAATSFACATVLSFYVPRYRVACFGLAALVALSRVYNGMHYPTDVLAGALLGVLIALLLLAAVRRRSRRERL